MIDASASRSLADEAFHRLWRPGLARGRGRASPICGEGCLAGLVKFSAIVLAVDFFSRHTSRVAVRPLGFALRPRPPLNECLAKNRVTATDRTSRPRRSLPFIALQPELAGECLCEPVSRREDTEVAVAAQRGVVARPSDDAERTRLLAGRRRGRAELRMEEDCERAAAVVAGEDLPDWP
jgi:hypothetical protein